MRSFLCFSFTVALLAFAVSPLRSCNRCYADCIGTFSETDILQVIIEEEEPVTASSAGEPDASVRWYQTLPFRISWGGHHCPGGIPDPGFSFALQKK
jgi:hypothetical protein